MERKICTQCNVEKNIEDFYNKYTECKIRNRNKRLKRYHEKKINYQINESYLMKKIEINY